MSMCAGLSCLALCVQMLLKRVWPVTLYLTERAIPCIAGMVGDLPIMGLEILEDQRVARFDGVDLALGARAFDVLAYLHALTSAFATRWWTLEQARQACHMPKRCLPAKPKMRWP